MRNFYKTVLPTTNTASTKVSLSVHEEYAHSLKAVQHYMPIIRSNWSEAYHLRSTSTNRCITSVSLLWTLLQVSLRQFRNTTLKPKGQSLEKLMDKPWGSVGLCIKINRWKHTCCCSEALSPKMKSENSFSKVAKVAHSESSTDTSVSRMRLSSSLPRLVWLHCNNRNLT